MLCLSGRFNLPHKMGDALVGNPFWWVYCLRPLHDHIRTRQIKMGTSQHEEGPPQWLVSAFGFPRARHSTQALSKQDKPMLNYRVVSGRYCRISSVAQIPPTVFSYFFVHEERAVPATRFHLWRQGIQGPSASVRRCGGDARLTCSGVSFCDIL